VLWLPAGGGKNDVPNRLKRQFACVNVPLPSVAAINGIFGRLVEGRFSSDVFVEEVVNVSICSQRRPTKRLAPSARAPNAVEVCVAGASVLLSRAPRPIY
jgi:hypothetical protein